MIEHASLDEISRAYGRMPDEETKPLFSASLGASVRALR